MRTSRKPFEADDIFSESSLSCDERNDSDDENEQNEVYKFGKQLLQLPYCFCSNEDIFREVLNVKTWKSVLNSQYGERLKKLLPQFPVNDEAEKAETLRKLLSNENFKFGNPMQIFFNKLKDGFLSSHVMEVTKLLQKANYKEYKNQQRKYLFHLLQDVLISRKKLLDASCPLPPDQFVKMKQFIPKPKDTTLCERTRLRYFTILHDIREETGENETSSEDENYPECTPPKVPKKHKKQVCFDASLSTEMSRASSAVAFLPDSFGSGHILNNSIDNFEISEDKYREMLLNHKGKMVLKPPHHKVDVSKVDLKDMLSRSDISKHSQVSNKTLELEASVLVNHLHADDASFIPYCSEPLFEITPPIVQEMEVQTDPLIIVEENEEVHNFEKKLSPPHPVIHQYPSSFFALLRDMFCESNEQKLSAIKLEEKVRNWQNGPTASLFDWLHIQESWSELVSSALKFLAGDLINILPETFVPFLDYKEKQQQWQWIGSGRDSDEQLHDLCQQWLENKDDIALDILETSQGSPPPPRVTTVWTVRPTSEDEKRIYREQECIRYQNPHKAFTFKVHGYEAVVGPVKGVYGKESGINKAREHSLLTSDRPPFVTILSLVRDSAARLPNGEGTRADICELLKDSQYLSPASDQQIHTVVSGALDRLHYEKDPCVKYDVNRKLWIYLHRNRTEEEFERIHQAQAAAAKARKAVQKNKIPKIKSKEVARTHVNVIPSMEALSTRLNHDISVIVTTVSSLNHKGGSNSKVQVKK